MKPNLGDAGDVSVQFVRTSQLESLSQRLTSMERQVGQHLRKTDSDDLLRRVAFMESQLAAGGSPKSESQQVAPKESQSNHLAKVPEASTSSSCQGLSSRAFSYHDEKCGKVPFSLQDLHVAFQIEQDYWAGQGSSDPWWAVDTQLPHSGVEVPMSTMMKFYTSGVDWVKDMDGHLKKAFGSSWSAQGTALDLGCGLGRMSFGLKALGYSKVVCVDQAQTMLDGARKVLTDKAKAGHICCQLGLSCCQTMLDGAIDFVQSGPDLLCKVPPSSVDFVHSVITLQHMKPMLQVSYIEQLCDTLKVGGTGYFQIPTNIVIEGWRTSDVHCSLKSEAKAMMMHYTPEPEVKRHLEARGCKVVLAEEKDRVGPVGYSMHFAFRKE